MREDQGCRSRSRYQAYANEHEVVHEGEPCCTGEEELARPRIGFDAFQVQIEKRKRGQHESGAEAEGQGVYAGVLHEGSCSLEMEVFDHYNLRTSRSL